MNKKKILEYLMDLQGKSIITLRERINELNKILDKARFDKTDFIRINKTSYDNLVSYNLIIENIDTNLRTHTITKVKLIPDIDINREQPVVNILSTKSNSKYILIKVEVLDKQFGCEKVFLYNKHNHVTRLITPQELKLYKE